MLTLSQEDRDRLAVLRQVEEGLLTPVSGSRKIGLSARQFRRLRRRYEAEGDSAVIHRGRGRPSNHRLPSALKQRALERAAEAIFRDFGPTLLSEHLVQQQELAELGALKSHTLRRWLIAAGLWEVTPRKLRHRRRRARRACLGELVQMDTSIHLWLEGRSAEGVVLIAMIDDATSRLFARFASGDSGEANRRTIYDYILRYGRPLAIYTDRATHFRHPKSRAQELLEEPKEDTRIGEALKALSIELISANSPQAKGRIERSFRTLQDRLIKELRVAGVRTLEEANSFLRERFLPWWNQRFTNPAADPTDAHRVLETEVDLLSLFASTEERRINPDFTIRYARTYWQISKSDAEPRMPGSTLTLEHRFDGELAFRWRGRLLKLTPTLRADPPQPPKSATPLQRPTRPAPAAHPWRRTNMAFSIHH